MEMYLGREIIQHVHRQEKLLIRINYDYYLIIIIHILIYLSNK